MFKSNSFQIKWIKEKQLNEMFIEYFVFVVGYVLHFWNVANFIDITLCDVFTIVRVSCMHLFCKWIRCDVYQYSQSQTNTNTHTVEMLLPGAVILHTRFTIEQHRSYDPNSSICHTKLYSRFQLDVKFWYFWIQPHSKTLVSTQSSTTHFLFC